LSQPILSQTGEFLHEVPVPKGVSVVMSIQAHHRYVYMLHSNLLLTLD
jgi:hypothetical protein